MYPTSSDIIAAISPVSATDNCGTPTITFVDGPVVTNLCSRSQTRTFTATDYCGNTTTISRIVAWTVDVTAPVITIAAVTPITICNPTPAQVSAAFGNATATDNCGAVTPTGVVGTETLVKIGRASCR